MKRSVAAACNKADLCAFFLPWVGLDKLKGVLRAGGKVNLKAHIACRKIAVYFSAQAFGMQPLACRRIDDKNKIGHGKTSFSIKTRSAR